MKQKKYLSFQLDHGIVASHRCYISESWNLAGRSMLSS